MRQPPLVVLTRARDDGLTFHVISLSRESRHAGRLVSVDEDELQLILAPGHDIAPQDAVSVAFSGGPRTCSFLTRVLDVDGERLWIATPDELLSADRRLRPRTTLAATVEVSFVEVPGAYQLVDLSPTGMGVRPPVALAVGTEVEATLRFGAYAAEVRAQLRHNGAGTSGFFFAGSVVRGRVRPLPGLRELLAAVTAV